MKSEPGGGVRAIEAAAADLQMSALPLKLSSLLVTLVVMQR